MDIKEFRELRNRLSSLLEIEPTSEYAVQTAFDRLIEVYKIIHQISLSKATILSFELSPVVISRERAELQREMLLDRVNNFLSKERRIKFADETYFDKSAILVAFDEEGKNFYPLSQLETKEETRLKASKVIACRLYSLAIWFRCDF